MAAALGDIFGALGVPDDDYTFVNTFGQEAIYNATIPLLGDHNANVAWAEGLLVERETDSHLSRYYLSTGGRLARVSNQARAEARKASGSWDTAYKLEQFGDRISGNRVQMAYMSTGQYGRHIQAVLNSDVNTRRHEMLATIFNNGPSGNSPNVFLDEFWGSLNVQPLANGDATVYPPIVGSEINATENNYLVTGFAPGAISDANDPLTPGVDKLEGHFGIPTGGSNIVAFVNKANVGTGTTGIQGMTLFNPIEARFQALGDDVSRAANWGEMLPGGARVLGEFAGKCLVVRWDWIPANYIFTLHLDAPRPLVRRIDPPSTGLRPGLQLLSQRQDMPFLDAEWSNRFGYGVGNRLNGVMTFIDAGGSYVVPAGFT